MTKWKAEYRINKKGAECFRTTDSETAYSKLRELEAKRAGIYTMQIRRAQVDRYGMLVTDCSGRVNWSAWM